MKIKRNVNGQDIEFELTNDECMWTYYEWQGLIDKDDIQDVLEEMGLSVTEEELNEIADQFRDHLSGDDNWRWLAETAINEVLNK